LAKAAGGVDQGGERGAGRSEGAGDSHRFGEALRAGASFRTVPTQPGTLAQVLRYFFQLAQRLGLYRLDLVLVFEHPLQLALAAPKYAHRGRVLQAHD
jgi:hypothetical protein